MKKTRECDCCGDVVELEDIIYLRDITSEDIFYDAACMMLEDKSGMDTVCGCCLEYKRDELIKQEHDDLAWRSFALGEPDRFSDTMRWFWNLA